MERVRVTHILCILPQLKTKQVGNADLRSAQRNQGLEVCIFTSPITGGGQTSVSYTATPCLSGGSFQGRPLQELQVHVLGRGKVQQHQDDYSVQAGFRQLDPSLDILGGGLFVEKLPP